MTEKDKLKMFLCNFLLFSYDNDYSIVLYYNKSFSVSTAILNHSDVNNFIQNYLDEFDDNLVIVYKSGKKNNVYDFLKVVDYNMLTENGLVVK